MAEAKTAREMMEEDRAWQMITQHLTIRADRFSDRKVGHPDQPAAQILSGAISGDSIMKRIPLTQGKFAIVDDDIYEFVNQWKWHAIKGAITWYAVRGHHTRMHRVIMGTPYKMETHHINGNGLDNRKDNLQICSKSNHNYTKSPKTGKYKGIAIGWREGIWQARITINGKRISLGYYAYAKEAARAYDKAALEYCGVYARTNF